MNKVLLAIAFRNIGRHKVKTLLTVLAIAIGTMLYIYTDSILKGLDIDSTRNVVNFETGSAKILTKKYLANKSEMPLYESFGNYDNILQKLDETGFDSAPRVRFKGTLLSKERELPFLFIGIEPKRERKVFSYPDYLESGQLSDDKEFLITLGVKGAKDLGVDVGDSVRLATTIDKRDKNGKIAHIYQIMDLKVGGIINSPNPIINGNIGFLPLSILQDQNGILLGGNISEIAIRKKNASRDSLPKKDDSANKVKEILANTLSDNLTVISWQEDAKDFLAISTTKKGSTSIIILLLFIIVTLVISNTVLLAIIERTKELGMMRALGMTDNEIFRMLLFEMAIIGFIGSIVGLIGGIAINFYMVNIGIDLTSLFSQMDFNIGYRIVGVIHSTWDLKTIIIGGSIGLVLSIIAAIFPAKKINKLNIGDALRFF